jgi:hypothetical protein
VVCCVFAQVVEGADGGRGRLGGGRERDGVLGEEPAGEDGGVADGGAVDAEEGGGDRVGQAEVAAETGDEDVVGDVDAAVAVRAGAADGVDPAAAAPEACLVVEKGAVGVFQRGGQFLQAAGLDAGEGGVVQDGVAVRRGRRVFRFRPGGVREQGVVPLAVPCAAG